MLNRVNDLSRSISILLVAFGLIIDLNPNFIMSGKGKIVIYVTPMIILFLNMLFQSKHAPSFEEKSKIKKEQLKLIFVIYVIALFTLLFLNNSYRNYSICHEKFDMFSKEHIAYSTNIKPLKTILQYKRALDNNNINFDIVCTNILGNLIAFAPFGFFISILLDEKMNFIKFTFFMISMVVLVEVIQFITNTGRADIDDVILNVLGACVTYAFMHIKLIKNMYKNRM